MWAEQRGAVVAAKTVIRVVARPADLREQRPDLSRNDALVLQTAKQVDLLFFGRCENPDVRRCELCEQFCQLTQLQKARIRIVCEVALGEHPEAHELLVVRLKMSEVRCLAALHGRSF